MSSVDSYIKCPKCGFECAYMSVSSNGYSFLFCGQCGYDVSGYSENEVEYLNGNGVIFVQTNENNFIGQYPYKDNKDRNNKIKKYQKKIKNDIVLLYFTYKENNNFYGKILLDKRDINEFNYPEMEIINFK